MFVAYADPRFGGHDIHLCRTLAGLEHLDVTLVTSDLVPPRYSNYQPRKVPPAVDNNEPMKVVRVRTLVSKGEVPLSPSLIRVFSRQQFDLVHIHEFFQFDSLVAFALAKARKKTVVLTQHGYYVPDGRARSLLFRFITRFLGKPLLRHVDQIICLTEAQLAFLNTIEDVRHKTTIIPTGTSIPPGLNSTPVPKTGPVRLIYVGRVDSRKGLTILFNTLHRLSKALTYSLDIVGGGPDLELYKDMATQLGLPVTFHGYVTHEQVPAFLRQADLLVLPTLTYEPFGICLVEALAHGVAVVGSAEGGIRTIVDDQVGLLFKKGSEVDLLGKLQLLLADRELLSSKKQLGREKAVREYDWSMIGKRVEKVYIKGLKRKMSDPTQLESGA